MTTKTSILIAAGAAVVGYIAIKAQKKKPTQTAAQAADAADAMSGYEGEGPHGPAWYANPDNIVGGETTGQITPSGGAIMSEDPRTLMSTNDGGASGVW